MRWEREELGKKTGCVLSADLLPGLATRGLLMRKKNAGKNSVIFFLIIPFKKYIYFQEYAQSPAACLSLKISTFKAGLGRALHSRPALLTLRYSEIGALLCDASGW